MHANVSWILRCTDATVAIGNLFRFSVAYNHMPLSLVKETRGVRFYMCEISPFFFPSHDDTPYHDVVISKIMIS